MFLIFVETPEFSSQFEAIAPNLEIANAMMKKIDTYIEENGLHGYGEMVPLSNRIVRDATTACEQLEVDLEWMAEHDML